MYSIRFKSLFFPAFFIVLVIAANGAFAQPNPPSPPPAPAVDGAVKDGEYPLFFDLAPFKVWVSRSGDVVRFALSAKTKGWIALGLGSLKMDGAAMFMGAVKDGQAVMSEQIGRGRTHADIPADKRLAAKYAVVETGDVTTMELEIPAAKAVPAGAKEISVILAHGRSDTLTEYHAARRAATLKLE